MENVKWENAERRGELREKCGNKIIEEKKGSLTEESIKQMKTDLRCAFEEIEDKHAEAWEEFKEEHDLEEPEDREEFHRIINPDRNPDLFNAWESKIGEITGEVSDKYDLYEIGFDEYSFSISKRKFGLVLELYGSPESEIKYKLDSSTSLAIYYVLDYLKEEGELKEGE